MCQSISFNASCGPILVSLTGGANVDSKLGARDAALRVSDNYILSPFRLVVIKHELLAVALFVS